jgi:signal transduction histidine kinase
MKLSLSARVALGLAAQMVVFGGAIGYLVWTSDLLFDRLSVLKDDLEPAVEDQRSLLTELKTLEDNLASARPPDIERVRGQLTRLRVFDRLQGDMAAMRKTAQTEGIEPSAVPELDAAIASVEEIVDGDRLVSGAAKTGAFPEGTRLPTSNRALFDDVATRLEASAGRDAESIAIARELLREARYIRASVLRSTTRAVAALRELNQDLFRQRSDISLAMVLVPAGTLVAALLLMLLTLRALKPVGELASAVRRLARGDYSTGAPARLSREFEDLAEALNALGAALKAREEESARSRDERMKAERLAVVGRMASVVAHEVRNPLNSIALNVDLLRDMLSDRGGGREVDVLIAVQREIDRLSEITEEYLRFGRLPKGVLAPCDAARIVRETVDFMSGEITAASVVAEVRAGDGPAMVRSDESQLRQALINILRNAVEAMPGGGRITVSVEARAGQVVLAVADTGCGIPEEFRQRLFEPFATTKPRGTGLGLAFVQQVMHESGGDVAIESAPGRGTTVSLRLRVAG